MTQTDPFSGLSKMLGAMGSMTNPLYEDWRLVTEFPETNTVDKEYILGIAKKAMLRIALSTNKTIYHETFMYKSSIKEELDLLKQKYSILIDDYAKILTSKTSVIYLYDISDKVGLNIISLSKEEFDFFESREIIKNE